MKVVVCRDKFGKVIGDFNVNENKMRDFVEQYNTNESRKLDFLQAEVVEVDDVAEFFINKNRSEIKRRLDSLTEIAKGIYKLSQIGEQEVRSALKEYFRTQKEVEE